MDFVPPQLRSYASKELAEIERFDQVIVRPGLQAGDTVGDRVSRGKHQYRDGAPRPAQPAAHLTAVDIRQHHIEDNEAIRAFSSHRQALFAARCRVSAIPRLLQAAANRLRYALFIFHQKYAHGTPVTLPAQSR